MKDRVDKLLPNITEEEKTELMILYNAWVKTVNAYKGDHAAENKKNWDAAKDGLEKTIEKLDVKYFHDEPAFTTRKEALKWLQDRGYKIKKTKFYDDFKPRSGDPPLIRMQPDGKVLEVAVRAYAATLDKVSDETKQVEKNTIAKRGKEVTKLEREIEKLEFELDQKKGKYILREDFDMELAARAAVLESGLRHLIQSRVPELMATAGAQESKANNVVEQLNRALDQLMNDFATTEKFQVMIMEEQPT